MARPDGRVISFGSPSPLAYWTYIWLHAWPAALLVVITPLFTALAFAALPESRRRAKVRARHVARVAMHGVLVPFLTFVLLIAGSTASALASPPIGRQHFLHYAALGVLLFGTLLWWQAAVRRYLRMEHSWAVAAATTIIGLLAPLTLLGATWYLTSSSARL